MVKMLEPVIFFNVCVLKQMMSTCEVQTLNILMVVTNKMYESVWLIESSL